MEFRELLKIQVETIFHISCTLCSHLKLEKKDIKKKHFREARFCRSPCRVLDAFTKERYKLTLPFLCSGEHSFLILHGHPYISTGCPNRWDPAIMWRPYDDSDSSEKVMLLTAAIKQ